MADSLPLDTRRYVPVEADDAPPTRIAAAKGRKSVLPIRPVLRGGNPVRHFRQDKAQTRFRSAPRHVERKPSMENSAPALARPKRWERYTLLVLFVGILLFGALVE